MEKKFRILLSIIFAIVMCVPAAAQNYVVDNIYGDSVLVTNIALSEDKTSEIQDGTAFYLQCGDTVTVTRILKGNSYPAITIKGKRGEYSISHGELRFCDNNPEDAVDRWAGTEWNKNRGLKKFFATFTPYAIIVILFIGAIAFLFLGLKVTSIRRPALYVVPITLLIASLMEMIAYWALGTKAFWWCDPDKCGFWGALVRVIPFICFVAFQLYSIKPYMHLLTGNVDNELSIKPMLISIGLCVPITLVVTFSCAGFFELRDTPLVIITVVTFLLTLGIGLFISTKKNIKELGMTAGIMFSLFGIIWSIGAVVALIGLIMVLFKLIIQILIVAAAGFIMTMASTRRYKDSWGNVYEEDGFGNRRKIQ